jgi:hypothetical protein
MKSVRMRIAGISVFVAAAMLAAQAGLIGFGVKDSEVKAGLANAVLSGHIPVYPSTKLYNAATPAARVAFVKAFMATAKAYSETAAFKADYAKRREGAKPKAPEAKGSADQQMSDLQVQQRKSLEEMKAQVAKMTPDMQKQMQPVIKQLEDQLSKQSSNPTQSAAMKNTFEAQGQADQEKYKKSLTQWSTDYPEQPDTVIAKRLKEFLALTADVDFDAKLEPEGGGRMRFANAQDEQKSSDWKLCYRAGREPVAAARALATDWLHQLGGS